MHISMEDCSFEMWHTETPAEQNRYTANILYMIDYNISGSVPSATEKMLVNTSTNIFTDEFEKMRKH